MHLITHENHIRVRLGHLGAADRRYGCFVERHALEQHAQFPLVQRAFILEAVNIGGRAGVALALTGLGIEYLIAAEAVEFDNGRRLGRSGELVTLDGCRHGLVFDVGRDADGKLAAGLGLDHLGDLHLNLEPLGLGDDGGGLVCLGESLGLGDDTGDHSVGHGGLGLAGCQLGGLGRLDAGVGVDALHSLGLAGEVGVAGNQVQHPATLGDGVVVRTHGGLVVTVDRVGVEALGTSCALGLDSRLDVGRRFFDDVIGGGLEHCRGLGLRLSEKSLGGLALLVA